MTRARHIPALLAAALIAAPAAAEDGLVPLEQAVTTNPDLTYALVRCAALYDSLVDAYSGDAIPEETEADYREAVGAMMRAAAVIRSGDALERVATEQVKVNGEVLEIAGRYAEHYRSASALDEGGLIDSDLETCRILLDLVQAE